MSNIKLSRISNKSKTSGPTFDGNTVFSGKESARLPIGDNSERVAIESGSLRYNDTAGLLEFYDGTQWNFIIPAQESANALGVFGGGYIAPEYIILDTIDYITISTLGDAKSFGTLSQARTYLAACSSSTRGVFGGGYNGPVLNTIDYITIATTGNATDFGDLFQARDGISACSSSTRGVFGGGNAGPRVNTIDYITIATTGNAQDFGDLFQPRGLLTSCSSSTRGIFAGGQTPSPTPTYVNTIDYITIASQGINAQDFGDLSQTKDAIGACSSSTRGVFGGAGIAPSVITMSIEYITISTIGNALDFGDLTEAKYYPGTCSSSTRGVFCGGATVPVYSSLDTIEYITIATTGNGIDFGNLTKDQTLPNGACSNNHGGLL